MPETKDHENNDRRHSEVNWSEWNKKAKNDKQQQQLACCG